MKFLFSIVHICLCGQIVLNESCSPTANTVMFTKNALYMKSIAQILGMMNSKISQEIDVDDMTAEAISNFIHMEAMYKIWVLHVCQKTSGRFIINYLCSN